MRSAPRAVGAAAELVGVSSGVLLLLGRRGLQGDDLAAAEGFEEGLETAGDQAAHDLALDHGLGDPGGPLDPPGGRGAKKGRFDPLRGVLCAHALNVGSGRRAVFGGTTDLVRS